MNYQDTAQQIIPLIGGKDNVQSLFHCITRLRFLLRDNSKADRHALEALDGVIGVNISGDQFQLIIGNDVKPLCDALLSQLPLQEASVRPASRCNPVSAVLEGLSGIFSPIIPAIAGAGILKGILALMVAFHWLETQNQSYQILLAISDGVFYFCRWRWRSVRQNALVPILMSLLRWRHHSFTLPCKPSLPQVSRYVFWVYPFAR